MKKIIYRMIAAALCLWLLPLEAFAAQSLVPVGQVIGLELLSDTVSVAAFDETLGVWAQKAGLQIGDEILDIDGVTVDSARDVAQALQRSDGQIRMRILRKDQQHELCLTPQITAEGPRLGVYLRQGVTGIGTVTWYDPATGRFGTLGHGVNNAKGELVQMTTGNAYPASVLSVKRGKCGEPGQLRGGVDCPQSLGTLEKNTHRGVFGSAETGWDGKTMEVAARNEIHTGAATIRSTVCGKEVREYSVEILKIYPEKRQEERNMLIRITDPALLEATGGIVQGMSGSPIIQDGKLVGAVTHVLVNDPTTGYGIFIENMLDAAA
ncbi:MAG: SpoIVB peptidase [Oscillospiraceae bacterium]|nr:SpoIVB peptidase [Oscillospiraceae bacterium]